MELEEEGKRKMIRIEELLNGNINLETINNGDICVITYKHNNIINTEYCTIVDIPHHNEIVIQVRLWKTIDVKIIRLNLDYIQTIQKINLYDSVDDIIYNLSQQSWELDLIISNKLIKLNPDTVQLIKVINNLHAHQYRVINLDPIKLKLYVYDLILNKYTSISIYDIENVYL